MIVKYITILFAIFAFSFVPSRADEKDLAKRALFTVKVNGYDKNNKKIQPRKGRAFAVAEHVLITAAHVTGRRDEFFLRFDANLNIPHRTVAIETVVEYSDPPDTKSPTKLYVTPAPIETVDAAKLTVPEFTATPFNLSACEINRNRKYFALILRGGDLGKPEFLSLSPDNYSSTDYGEIYVFENDGYPGKMIVDGDSGSPVLNESNEVVGLVSAEQEESKKVLVTRVKSFIDLIPDGKDVKCDQRVTRANFKSIETKLTKALERLKEAHHRASAALGGFFGAKYDLSADQVKELIEELEKEEPIYEVINRWKKDLGSEKWSLKWDEQQGLNEITLEYQRQISKQKFSNIAYLCFAPLLDENAEEEDHYILLDKNAKKDPTNYDYYCDRSKHLGSSGITKSGLYHFTHSMAKAKRDLGAKERWDRRYYVQFLAENDQGGHDIVRRYLILINEDGAIRRCSYFASRQEIAELVKASRKVGRAIAATRADARRTPRRGTRRAGRWPESPAQPTQLGYSCEVPL